ncbi:TIGR00730 family Rossman fold protein [Candidatus Dependentiae bacterium]|jgi:uncharacterized protein (TIGR00730 family)|nr:TIGR00730 family Rossman fold protein [Candidatus Dependentiae bacterium]
MCRRIKEYSRFLKSLFKTNVRLLWGMWKLTKLPHPAITIFGGSRIALESEVALKAKDLSFKLVDAGFSIITGGGPGIMEAANFGAIEYLRECDLNSPMCRNRRIVSAGIGLIRLNKEKANPYVQENIVMEHFFSRKWLLVRYSVGFVIFPGGFGTMDELFEIVTLVQTQRMKKLPIVLVDIDYWKPLVDWIDTRALKQGLITKEDVAILKFVDTVDEAFEYIKSACIECTESKNHI